MNPEIDTWRRDAELFEKDLRHPGIEMLPGVQYDLLDVAALRHRA